MNWYYMKKGLFQNRGIVSRPQLETMVRNGKIAKTDLLYSDDTHGKWVRANSIPDLFPHTPPQPIPAPAPKTTPPPQPPAPLKQTPQKPRSISFRTHFVLLCIALLAILALIFAGLAKKENPPTPPSPPAIPEETNVWASVETDITGLIQNGSIKEAAAVISNYISDCGTNEISNRLQAKLNHKIKQERLKELYSIFKKNTASLDQMKALVALSDELGETANLGTTLRSAVLSKPTPSPAACRSMLAIGRILKDSTLQQSAVIVLGDTFNNWSSGPDCFEMVNLYLEYQMTDKAVSLLQKFTESNPDDSAAWLELAALLSGQKNEEDCLAALKKAVQTGGDSAREKARKDPRFDFVRDTWTFKWQTR